MVHVFALFLRAGAIGGQIFVGVGYTVYCVCDGLLEAGQGKSTSLLQNAAGPNLQFTPGLFVPSRVPSHDKTENSVP